jgi:SAM-dependent methyltransferase
MVSDKTGETPVSRSFVAGALFDLDEVFEVDDHMFAYRDDLTGERSDAEVAALARMLGLDSPMRILDLACGFGRHANRLAALGHTVTGVDYMPGFLALAHREAREMGVHEDYRQGDMRQIDFHEEFDVVLLLFTSFGYFEDQENELVLENMARALRPGGRLMLDTLNRDTVLRDLRSDEVIDKGDGLLINRCSFDVLTGRLQNRRIIIRSGVRKDKVFSIRLYNPSEIRRLLDQFGLVDQRLLDRAGQPLSSEPRRMVVIATKPVRD